jgi:hypothetical protein
MAVDTVSLTLIYPNCTVRADTQCHTVTGRRFAGESISENAAPQFAESACPRKGWQLMTAFVMAAMLLGFNSDAVPMCFASDVRKLCCPSACATKNSPKWPKANEVLRACMRGVEVVMNTPLFALCPASAP